MPLNNSLISTIAQEATAWRHWLHQNPELSFQEQNTSQFIQEKLQEWGYELDRSLSNTGLVASINVGNVQQTIAIRADIDALAIQEQTGLSYSSQNPGVMHACGHDAHTAILLGTAKYLMKTQNFYGRVLLIFQAAEEGGGKPNAYGSGAQELVTNGLFDKYQINSIFTLHNVPKLALNMISVKKGPLLASQTHFEIILQGKNAHVAKPELGASVIPDVAQILKQIDLLKKANSKKEFILETTILKAGDAINIIPSKGEIKGSIRAFQDELTSQIKHSLEEIVQKTTSDSQIIGRVEFVDRSPAVINNDELVEMVLSIAKQIKSVIQLDMSNKKFYTSDDFAHYLKHTIGCYIGLGTGTDTQVHNEKYLFDDQAIETGIEFWCTLVEKVLENKQ